MQAKIFSSLLIVGFILCLLSRVSSFNIRKLNNPNPKGQNWVVLVAGSNGYFNYRHQADICHAYKIVTDRGIPASNIITFMFDDIAFNQDNPQKGIIINEYNGTNVYPGKEAIDYRGEDVTPEVFLSVLRGETNITRGNGKTLKSGPNDRIFIYFADHGATNILAFPGFNVLHSQDLLDTLQYMYKKRMYSQLLFYVEACESGSMFNSILNANLNVYAETASTPFESSYACDYSNDVNAYLNDCYSINWMNDTDFCDVRKETIAEQFDNVLKETTTSHVCKYGDMSFEDETLIYFQGNVTTYKETKPRRKVNNPIRKPLNSRFVYEDYLIKRMTKAKLESSMPTFIKYETEYQTFLKKKARTDFIFSQLSTKFNLGTLQKYRRQFIEDMMRVNPSKTCYSDEQADLRCVKTHIQIFEKVCGKFDEYSIQFASHLKDTCLMNVKSEDLYQFLKQTC